MKDNITKIKCKTTNTPNVLYLRVPDANFSGFEIGKIHKDIIKIVRPRQSRRFVFLHFENEEKAKNAHKEISQLIKLKKTEIFKKNNDIKIHPKPQITTSSLNKGKINRKISIKNNKSSKKSHSKNKLLVNKEKSIPGGIPKIKVPKISKKLESPAIKKKIMKKKSSLNKQQQK